MAGGARDANLVDVRAFDGHRGSLGLALIG